MADDRLRIRCRHCGADTMLSKLFNGRFEVYDREKVCDWIDLHQKHWEGNVNLPDRCFDLYTENGS